MNREQILAELATTDSATREAKLHSMLSELDSMPAEPAVEEAQEEADKDSEGQQDGGDPPPRDPQ